MGINSRIFDKWWFRAIFALCLFFLWQFFYAVSKLQGLEEERITVQATIESLSRKADDLRHEIFRKEQEVFRLEKKSERISLLVRDRVGLIDSSRADDPMIYFITPTSFRAAQKADMTRLSHTLSHVPKLTWIVVEDAENENQEIRAILKRSQLPFTYLIAPTPAEQKMKYNQPNWYLPRGVIQRNTALSWIRNQLGTSQKGVIYFGDDDNTYDLRLFDEMRKIQKAGVWPVGIVGGLFVETPELYPNGSISGFNSIWKPERPFPIDMAAFAVNLTLVLSNSEAEFSFEVPRGYQESTFLGKIGITREIMEPLADNCTKVYVWHTRTEKSVLDKKMVKRLQERRDFSALEKDALGAENILESVN